MESIQIDSTESRNVYWSGFHENAHSCSLWKQHTEHESMIMTSCVVIRMILSRVLWSFCNASFDVWKFEHICIVPVAKCCTELNFVETPAGKGFDFRNDYWHQCTPRHIDEKWHIWGRRIGLLTMCCCFKNRTKWTTSRDLGRPTREEIIACSCPQRWNTLPPAQGQHWAAVCIIYNVRNAEEWGLPPACSTSR